MYFEIDFKLKDVFCHKIIDRAIKHFMGSTQYVFKMRKYEESKHFLLKKLLVEEYMYSDEGFFFHQSKEWFFFDCQQTQKLFVSKDHKKFIIYQPVQLNVSYQFSLLLKVSYKNFLYLVSVNQCINFWYTVKFFVFSC